jgi:hypothetical protein
MTSYLLRNILMPIGVFDPALSLAGAALAKSYSARNLSPCCLLALVVVVVMQA